MAPTKLALVTGTSSGIGAAVARQLVDRGWRVIGVARRDVRLAGAYQHVVADLGQTKAAVHEIETGLARAIGRADIVSWDRVGLVNNAASAGLLMPLERLDAGSLLDMYAVNTAAPIALMGVVLRCAPERAATRIVNVSSGAAVRAFNGLGAYASSKAALRMAGMVLASELDSPSPGTPSRDAAILSYEPGTVDTPMQAAARSRPPEEFPWVDLFRRFAEEGALAPPERPAAEIVEFLESDRQPRFSESRFGRPRG